MAQVRGRDLIDAVDFLRDRYGAAAVQAVLSRIPLPEREAFYGSLRDVAWYPLETLVALLRTAKAALAPADEGFFVSQGRYAAERQKAAFLGVMVTTPEARARTAPTIWRMFYNAGRLVVSGHDPATATGQIHDFPTTPELCERFRGIWEGMANTADRRAVATETRCVLRGDPFCEFSVSYLA